MILNDIIISLFKKGIVFQGGRPEKEGMAEENVEESSGG